MCELYLFRFVWLKIICLILDKVIKENYFVRLPKTEKVNLFSNNRIVNIRTNILEFLNELWMR